MNDPNTVLIIMLVFNIITSLHAAPFAAKMTATLSVQEYGRARLLWAWAFSTVMTGLWIWFAAVTGYWLIAAVVGSSFLINRAVSAASMQRRKAGAS